MSKSQLFKQYAFRQSIRTACLLWLFMLFVSGTVGASKDPTNKEYIDQGRALLEKNNAKEALEVFRKAVDLQPDHAESHYWYGRALVIVGKVEEGTKHLKTSVKLAPNNISLRFPVAELFERIGNYKEALDQYRVILQQHKKGENADLASKKMTVAMANQHIKKGDYESAAFLFNDLLDQYPNDTEIMIWLATSYFSTKNYPKAEMILKNILKKNKADLNAKLHLATLYEVMGREKEFQEQLNDIIKRDSKGEFGHRAAIILALRTTRLLELQERFEDALSNYEEIVKQDSNNLAALFGVATNAQRLKKFSRAIEVYQQILKINPVNADARLNLASAMLDSNQIGPAVAELEKVVQTSPNPQMVDSAKATLKNLYKQIAAYSLSRGESAKGLEVIERVLKVDPKDISARIQKGLILFQGNQFFPAKKEFEEIIKMDPNNSEALFNLGLIYESIGLTSEAEVAYAKVNNFERGKEIGLKAGALILTLGAKRLFNEGKLTHAQQEFEDILKTDMDNISANFYLALIHQRNNDLKKTAERYNEVLRINPNNTSARLNLGMNYENMEMDEAALKEYRQILRVDQVSNIGMHAKSRLAAVEARMDGFNFSLNYGMNLDDNINYGNPEATGTEQSNNVLSTPRVKDNSVDLGIQTTYRYNFMHGLRSGLSFNATYSTFHVSNFDFIRYNVSPYLVIGPYRANTTLSYTRNTTNGLLRESLYGTANSYRIDSGFRFNRKPLISWLAGESRLEKISSRFRFYLDYREFISAPTTLAFNNTTYTLGLNYNQIIRPGFSTDFSYGFGVNNNDHVNGNDYANNNHTINLSTEKSLFLGLVGNFSYGLIASSYKNDDSGLLEDERVKKKRFNLTNSLDVRLRYYYHENLSFGLGYVMQINSSNLNVRCISGNTAQPCVANSAAGLNINQQGTLGSYKKNTYFFNVSLSFR